jgi:predicted 3-demethylubiquinone-9 3-methyltransferase (glyoxalase superfamily)
VLTAEEELVPKIVPCLWFNDDAEDAVALYTSIFRRSKVKEIARYGRSGAKASGRPGGSVMTIAFEIEGQEFLALNGGPAFTFSPAISLVVSCRTQREIDRLWAKLSADRKAERCGWLRDRFGVSWQIVPDFVADVMAGQDPERAERVMAAILAMKKLDLAALRRAARRRARRAGHRRGSGPGA